MDYEMNGRDRKDKSAKLFQVNETESEMAPSEILDNRSENQQANKGVSMEQFYRNDVEDGHASLPKKEDQNVIFKNRDSLFII